jgi:protein-tyrosine-phosphatase
MVTQLRELDVDLVTRGHLEKALESLREEFAGVFSSETVERFMAESLAALVSARSAYVRSARRRGQSPRTYPRCCSGSDPADRVNPNVVAAMSELEIDLGKEFPKPMTDEVVEAADAVVTMSCGDACPIYPGKRYEDWEVDDPAEADLEGVRRIRDDIAARVKRLLDELAPAA